MQSTQDPDSSLSDHACLSPLTVMRHPHLRPPILERSCSFSTHQGCPHCWIQGAPVPSTRPKSYPFLLFPVLLPPRPSSLPLVTSSPSLASRSAQTHRDKVGPCQWLDCDDCLQVCSHEPASPFQVQSPTVPIFDSPAHG